ncbi:hypothetical protein ACSDBR_01310 [Acidithiobacillus ferriphilus]|uniref:hypothetical protein n=1 Tax=Acidithiobacillus ferriphilus TaxID=1689834 RepID=UPI003F5120F0
MTTEQEAFAIYLNYAPEMEFLYWGDSEDKAFIESMQNIVSGTEDLQTFLDDVEKLYRLAAKEFFDRVVDPLQKTIINLAKEKYSVAPKKRIKAIERDHRWKFRSRNNSLLFEFGFLFTANQGKCTAVPWFWSGGNSIKLDYNQQADRLKEKFSFPRAGNWYRGTLVANPVEYSATIDIEKLNENLISPIAFAVKSVTEHIER